ncbi:hypothetical protein BCR36DRAFT_587605 [Piromyces finnis]|uniref:Uncharacterized protein n=1 Tax=Piromyces finnis TaxID=1754191 RepID=A0A1Y1UVB7_9FUNG|nr:hypothetical protein BCR36DRAFT_587605 [Piromyces finnis]|eukprot:ORX41960.1 hypothetical protein BCR36DRAFT_587605 [Piromyces finnis]
MDEKKMDEKKEDSSIQLLNNITDSLNNLIKLIPENLEEKRIDGDNSSSNYINTINDSLNLLKANVTTTLVKTYENPELTIQKEIKELEKEKDVKDYVIQRTYNNLRIWNSILNDLEQREKTIMNRSYKNEPSVMKVIEIYPEPLKK